MPPGPSCNSQLLLQQHLLAAHQPFPTSSPPVVPPLALPPQPQFGMGPFVKVEHDAMTLLQLSHAPLLQPAALAAVGSSSAWAWDLTVSAAAVLAPVPAHQPASLPQALPATFPFGSFGTFGGMDAAFAAASSELALPVLSSGATLTTVVPPSRAMWAPAASALSLTAAGSAMAVEDTAPLAAPVAQPDAAASAAEAEPETDLETMPFDSVSVKMEEDNTSMSPATSAPKAVCAAAATVEANAAAAAAVVTAAVAAPAAAASEGKPARVTRSSGAPRRRQGSPPPPPQGDEEQSCGSIRSRRRAALRAKSSGPVKEEVQAMMPFSTGGGSNTGGSSTGGSIGGPRTGGGGGSGGFSFGVAYTEQNAQFQKPGHSAFFLFDEVYDFHVSGVYPARFLGLSEQVCRFTVLSFVLDGREKNLAKKESGGRKASKPCSLNFAVTGCCFSLRVASRRRLVMLTHVRPLVTMLLLLSQQQQAGRRRDFRGTASKYEVIDGTFFTFNLGRHGRGRLDQQPQSAAGAAAAAAAAASAAAALSAGGDGAGAAARGGSSATSSISGGGSASGSVSATGGGGGSSRESNPRPNVKIVPRKDEIEALLLRYHQLTHAGITKAREVLGRAYKIEDFDSMYSRIKGACRSQPCAGKYEDA
ncbi:unnamed protein product [Phaeothamnion confervicola]